MKKTLILLISIVAIAISLIFLYLRFFSWFPSNAREVNDLMNELDNSFSDELPVGTDAAQVQLFLESRKIEHSELSDDFKMDSDYQSNTKLDGKRDKIASYITAIKRNVGYSGLVMVWNISIRFYFDEQKKLVAHTLKVAGTGL